MKPPSPGTGLYLSSSGGHFPTLLYVARRFKANEKSVVVTYESSDTQTEALEFSIHYFPYVKSRRIIPLIKMSPAIFKIIKANEFNYVASTGAGIAIIGYLLARLEKIPFYYVEDFNRQFSLSLTARILKRIGLKKIFVQSPSLANSSNMYLENPINSYVVRASNQPIQREKSEIFVALGTIKGFTFTRAIDLVLSIVEDSDEINWQIGNAGYSDISSLPGTVHRDLERDHFHGLIKNADIVICHGGNGIIGESLAAGKIPVVIPRRKSFGEHIDDHQVELIEYLSGKDLVINLELHPSRNELNEILGSRIVTQQEIM